MARDDCCNGQPGGAMCFGGGPTITRMRLLSVALSVALSVKKLRGECRTLPSPLLG